MSEKLLHQATQPRACPSRSSSQHQSIARPISRQSKIAENHQSCEFADYGTRKGRVERKGRTRLVPRRSHARTHTDIESASSTLHSTYTLFHAHISSFTYPCLLFPQNKVVAPGRQERRRKQQSRRGQSCSSL